MAWGHSLRAHSSPCGCFSRVSQLRPSALDLARSKAGALPLASSGFPYCLSPCSGSGSAGGIDSTAPITNGCFGCSCDGCSNLFRLDPLACLRESGIVVSTTPDLSGCAERTVPFCRCCKRRYVFPNPVWRFDTSHVQRARNPRFSTCLRWTFPTQHGTEHTGAAALYPPCSRLCARRAYGMAGLAAMAFYC